MAIGEIVTVTNHYVLWGENRNWVTEKVEREILIDNRGQVAEMSLQSTNVKAIVFWFRVVMICYDHDYFEETRNSFSLWFFSPKWLLLSMGIV